MKHTLNARNFWAATPPKVSVLHYDWQDSVLLQIAGTKRFTIIDPARMQTAYPCVAYLQQLKRTAPGVFETILTSRELDNFPLLNVSSPDLDRHPLAKEAHVFTVDLQPGDALLLPAYWCSRALHPVFHPLHAAANQPCCAAPAAVRPRGARPAEPHPPLGSSTRVALCDI